jgi:hypothetical protein
MKTRLTPSCGRPLQRPSTILQQLDSYSAQVYMKGTGKLVDYPWLAKKMIEKEGIKKGQAFVSESVSEIKVYPSA